MVRLILVPLLGFAFALGACGDDDDDGGGGGGSSDKVGVGDYASAVCKSTQDWVDVLQTRATDLASSLGTDVSPQEGKDALAGYLDDVLGDTDKWIQAVDDAGVPDVEGGEEAAEEFRTAAEDAKEVLDDTRNSVEDLPTDDEQKFATEAGKVGTATQKSLENVGGAISTPDSQDLQTAFTENKACQQLGTG